MSIDVSAILQQTAIRRQPSPSSPLSSHIHTTHGAGYFSSRKTTPGGSAVARQFGFYLVRPRDLLIVTVFPLSNVPGVRSAACRGPPRRPTSAGAGSDPANSPGRDAGRHTADKLVSLDRGTWDPGFWTLDTGFRAGRKRAGWGTGRE